MPVARGDAEGWVWTPYVRAAGTPPPWLLDGVAGCQRAAFLFNIGVGCEPQLDLLDLVVHAGVPATVFPMGR